MGGAAPKIDLFRRRVAAAVVSWLNGSLELQMADTPGHYNNKILVGNADD